MVAGQNRVVNMREVYLKLCRCKFRRCRVCRDSLRLTAVVQVVQELLDFPQVVWVINLRAGLWPAEAGYMRSTLGRFIGVGVEQVENSSSVAITIFNPIFRSGATARSRTVRGSAKNGSPDSSYMRNNACSIGTVRPGNWCKTPRHDMTGNIRVTVAVTNHAGQDVAK